MIIIRYVNVEKLHGLAWLSDIKDTIHMWHFSMAYYRWLMVSLCSGLIVCFLQLLSDILISRQFPDIPEGLITIEQVHLLFLWNDEWLENNGEEPIPVNKSVNGTWLGRKLYMIQEIILDMYWQADIARKRIFKSFLLFVFTYWLELKTFPCKCCLCYIFCYPL